MTKKQKARQSLDETQAKVAKLDEELGEAREQAGDAREEYLAAVRGEIIEEFRTLEWEKFKGRGSKSQLQVIMPEGGAALELHGLFNPSMRSHWRRLQFHSDGDSPHFEIEFLKGDYTIGYAWYVRAKVADLRALGIVPAVLDKRLRRAARKVVDDAGLDAEDLAKAIADFKGKASEES